MSSTENTLEKPLISTIRSVIVRTANPGAARSFYEDALGLECTGETEAISSSMRALWGLRSGDVRLTRFAKPGEDTGMIELVEWSEGTSETIRDPLRPCDYGLFSLNHLTADMDRAVPHLQRFGVKFISPPQSYDVGRPIREVMCNTTTGERCTILQVGEADKRTSQLFGKPVATVGMTVAHIADALAFYRDGMKLSVAITMDQIGDPFATMLGAPADTRLQMLLMTSGHHWTGKFEFLRLTPPDGTVTINSTQDRFDGRYTGYWMFSVNTHNLEAVIKACEFYRLEIVRGPLLVDRPFEGTAMGIVIRVPGGCLMECLEPSHTVTE